MRFIHVADVHLGIKPDAGKAYSAQRSKEIWEAFRAVLEKCEESRMDLLLIAGDLFHRQPLLRELKEVAYLFSKLSHTKVVLIAGNHDYVRTDSFYRTFVWPENVTALLSEEMETAMFPELKTAVYGFSYHRREIRECLYDNAAAQGNAPYKIMLAHGGDQDHIPVNRQKLAALGYSYIAMGHIHKPQELLKNYAAYAGSLEPTDVNDIGQHGYIQGEITDAGTKIEFVPAALRQYKHMSLKVSRSTTQNGLKDYIGDQIRKQGVENLYRITLKGMRDPDIMFETADLDQYGNVLDVRDETVPFYDFDKLYRQNQDNIIGHFIQSFQGCMDGSLEYEALCEGVNALMETKRG